MGPNGDMGGLLHVMIPGDPVGVREGLRAVFAADLLRDIAECDRGTAEIVMAEVLNNIVEHAYAGLPGVIELKLQRRAAELICQVEDAGRPMPGARLPEGGLADFSTPDNLPEGGFGWHLIRSLARGLSYRRIAGRNVLRFRLDATQ